MPNLSNMSSTAAHGARALMVGLAALVAAPALAVDDSELVVSPQGGDVRMVEVRIGDLDLTSAYDRDTLEIRIDRAARAVCDVNKGSKLDQLPDARQCVDQAREGAMAQVAVRGDGSADMRSAGG